MRVDIFLPNRVKLLFSFDLKRNSMTGADNSSLCFQCWGGTYSTVSGRLWDKRGGGLKMR